MKNSYPLDENRDRLHKVRLILDILRRQCKSVWYPGKELSVDQSLVLFKGRVKFRQYIKTKRARFGIKLYALATSDGITLDFLVYCGKGMLYNDNEHSSTSATERKPTVLMGHTWGRDMYSTEIVVFMLNLVLRLNFGCISGVHCNNLTNPSLVTEQVRYFGYIKRACFLGVIQKCRHTWRGGGTIHNCDIYCYKIIGSIKLSFYA